MRIYAYFRVDDMSKNWKNCEKTVSQSGYIVPSKRIILEEVMIGVELKYRDKFINLINYTMESGDLLLVKGIDCFGSNFNEVISSVELIYKKNIRLICLEFSKNEIIGDLKIFFLHFLKLCCDFEVKIIFYKKSVVGISSKRAGRPEILNDKQKKDVLNKYKKGASISSLAKYYSVTRTVIRRLILKSSCNINIEKKVNKENEN